MRVAQLLNRIVTALTISSLIVPPALAQEIMAGGSAPPQLLTSANGTPLIMIQTPNASGVSHNTYDSFNVGTSGVVLNNIGTNYGLTGLAGYVQGNSNLVGGTARVIINEVTSANPSNLGGYVEVGGAAADVVIANPWGITCNGCGFINTPRAVLTTGTPTFSGGDLQGFSVNDGTIAIGNLGADARGVSQFDLIARKVTFDGSVHGQRVRIIAGRNDVLFATNEATAKASDGSSPEYAIDSTVLGGMYAGEISILSTEAGVGVRAPAKMSSNAGSMTITADGRLIIGEAASSGRTTARGQDVTVQKSVSSKSELSISALRDLVLEADAVIVTEAAANVAAGRDLTFGAGATVYSETALTLSAPGRFTAQAGARALSFGDLTLTAGSMTAGSGSTFYAGLTPEGGTARTANLTLTIAGNATANSAAFFATGRAVFDAAEITIDADSGLDPSQFVAAGPGSLTADRLTIGRAGIEATGNLSLEGRTALSTGAGTRIATAAELRLTAGEMALAGGLIAAGQGLTLTATNVTQAAANILSAGGQLAATATTGNLQGTIQGAGVNLAFTGDASLSGQVQSTASLTVTGRDLTLSGDTASRGNQSLVASGVLSLTGTHRSTESTLALTASSALVEGDLIAVSVTGDISANTSVSGTIISLGQTSLRSGSLDLGMTGNIVSGGAMTLAAQSGSLTLDGTLQSNADLNLVSAQGITQGIDSQIIALNAVNLTAQGAVTLAGQMAANGTIGVTTPGAIIMQSGAMLASMRGDIQIGAGDSGADLGGTMKARDIIVSAGQINHTGTLTAGRLTSLTSTTGSIDLAGDQSSAGLLLTSADDINHSGTIRAAVQAKAVGDFTNTGKIDAGLFSLEAHGFSNAATKSITIDGNAVLILTGNAANHGDFTTKGSLSVQSAANVENTGLMDAETSLILQGVGINNAGKLEATDIALSATDILNSGTLNGIQDVTALAQASLTNAGTIRAGDDLSLDADRFTNSGQIAAADGILSLRGVSLLDNKQGQVSGGKGLLIATNQDIALQSADNSAASLGNFASGDWINIQGANGGAAGTLRLAAGEALVAAGDLVIQAAGVVNAGTIASGTGNLVMRASGDLTNTGLFYAGGDWLMLRAGGAVLNDGGTMLAADNLVICGNGTTNCLSALSTDRATSLTNKNGGRIESMAGDLILAAAEIKNEREVSVVAGLPTTTQITGILGGSITCFVQSCPPDPAALFLSAQTLPQNPRCVIGFGDSCYRYSFFYDETHTVIQETLEFGSNIASIVSGGSIVLVANTIENRLGVISAISDISVSTGTLENVGMSAVDLTTVQRKTSYETWILRYSRNEENGEWYRYDDTRIIDISPATATSVITDTAFGTIEAGGTISGSITGEVSNGAVNANALTLTATPGTAPTVAPIAATAPTLVSGSFAGILAPDNLTDAPLRAIVLAATGVVVAPTTVSPSTLTAGFDLTALGNDQLFAINATSATSPLIESRHQFIDLSAFVSSDYFLASLRFDPEITQRRLGDALVETTLIRNQVVQLTGGRILDPNLSEREQIKAMYDNAINSANSLNLRPGVALTPAQIAGLTSNIIWMEERVVSGQRVLVPQVYLASTTPRPGATDAARISANRIVLDTGSLANTGGTIRAADALVIKSATDIKNSFGALTAGNGTSGSGFISLDAANGNMTNLSGLITAGTIAISALNITNATERMTFRDDGKNLTQIAGAKGQILATDNLSLSAIKDVTITGADLRAGRDLTLLAGKDITLDALELTNKVSLQSGNSLNEFDKRRALTSSLTAVTGDLSILSAEFSDEGALTGGGDITTKGAALNAAGKLSVQAAMGHVSLGAARETDYSRHFSSGGGWLSSFTNRSESFDLTHIETALKGGEVNVFAGGALISEGAKFTSTQTDLRLRGGAELLLATTDIHARYNHSSRSFLGGLFDSSTTTKDLRTLADTTQATSARDIFVDSASKLTLQGTELDAARNIVIKAVEETTLLATVNTTFNSTVTHRNNGFLVTDTTKVSLVQTASFPSITAGGATDFDPGKMATLSLDEQQSSFGTTALGLIGIDKPDDLSTRLGVMEQVLFPKEPEPKPEGEAQKPAETPKGSTNPAYDFAGSKVNIGRPTALDGAEFAYLDTLFDQGKLTVEEMQLVQHEFFKQDVKLSPAFKMLLAAAVSWTGVGAAIGNSILGGVGITGAYGVSATGVLQASTWLGHAATAFGTSLTTGVLEGALTGNFDIGKILEGALFSAVSAGLVSAVSLESLGIHLGDAAKNPLWNIGNKNLTMSALMERGLDAVVTSSLSSVVYGTDFATNLRAGIISAVIDLAGADLQNVIGAKYGAGTAGSWASHLALGCLKASATGADCSAGMVGAATEQLFVKQLTGPRPPEGTPEYEAWKTENSRNLAFVSAFTGYLTSGGKAENVTAASDYAVSAFRNNYLGFTELHRLEKELEDCKDAKVCINRTFKKYVEISKKLDAEFAACKTDECRTFHLARISAVEKSSKFDALINNIATRYGVVFDNSYGETLKDLQYDRAENTIINLSAAQLDKVDKVTEAQLRKEVAAVFCSGGSVSTCDILTRYNLERWGVLSGDEVTDLRLDILEDQLIRQEQAMEELRGNLCGAARGPACDQTVADEIARKQALAARKGGAVMVVGGVLEVVSGAAVATTCATGIGCVAAGGLVVLGADTAGHGMVQLWTGKQQTTFLEQTLQGAGLTPGQAAVASALISGGAGIAAVREIVEKSPQLLTDDLLGLSLNNIDTALQGTKYTKTEYLDYALRKVRAGETPRSAEGYLTARKAFDEMIANGSEFERKALVALGIDQRKKALKVTMPDGTTRITIPDGQTVDLIIECKNYCKTPVKITDQIDAQLEWARANNKGYSLVLPPGAVPDPALVEKITRINNLAGNPTNSGILRFDMATGQFVP